MGKIKILGNRTKTELQYSPGTVSRREYLLFAQVILGNIMNTKARRDSWNAKLEKTLR